MVFYFFFLGEMMITIESEEEEFFDEQTNRFITLGVDGVFTFNHCLKSIDEWESKYKKPFLTEGNKTKEEMFDYYRIMCIDKEKPKSIGPKLVKKLEEYMSDPMSATTVNSKGNKSSGAPTILTSEVLYAYMANASLWIECENWHINKLLKLLSVIGALQKPTEKMDQREVNAIQRKQNLSYREKIEAVKRAREAKENGGIKDNH